MKASTRKRTVTLADVGRAAGVSPAAASYALNDRPGVSDATRAHVKRAADELGWFPHARGRALAYSRAFTVGIVHARPAHLLSSDPFFASFLAGVEESLSPAETGLLLRVIADVGTEPDVYRRLAKTGKVDGFILADMRRRDPRPRLLDELEMPAVALARPVESARCSWVYIDDTSGVRAAVDHLVQLGHRDIAHVAGPAVYVHSRSRESAWRCAVRRHALPPGAVEVGDFTAEGGAAATKRLLDADVVPSAIVYANDLMALAGMGVLADAGLSVPRDVSVVGFDDVPMAAFSRPPLSSVRADVQGWARAGAAELLARIDGRPPRAVALDAAELVLRGSTAAPRATPRDQQTSRRRRSS